MADTNAQVWVGYHGDDVPYTAVGEDDTDPSGFSLLLTVGAYPGGPALVSLTQSSMTITGSGPYTITWQLTRAQTGTTLAHASYPTGIFYWELSRQDSGHHERLAGGKLVLLVPVAATA